MNRREIKLTAQEAAQQAGKAAKLITLVYLLCRAGLYGLQYLCGFLTSQTTTSRHLSDSITAGARNMLLSVAIALLLQLVARLLFTGYARAALQIHRRQPVPMNTLLEGFQIPLRVIALEVLRTLLLIVWCYAFTLPVTFLLVVPLSTAAAGLNDEAWMKLYMIVVFSLTAIILLVVSYRYRGALFLLLDHPELSPWQCLRTASAMTRGHRMELFLLDLSLVPWMLLCGLTAGIFLIWKMPYFSAVYAGAYEALDRLFREKLEKARELRQQFPPQI